MKRLLVTVFLATLAYATFAQHSYRIEGTTALDLPVTLYKLPDPSKKEMKEIPGRTNARMITDYKEKVAEATLQDGKFEFTGTYTQPEIYCILIPLGERGKEKLFVIDSNNITVDINAEGTIAVSGSELTERFDTYREELGIRTKESSDLMRSIVESGDPNKLRNDKELQEKVKAAQQKTTDYNVEFAKNNINNVAGQYALGSTVDRLTIDQLKDIVAQANNATLTTPVLKKAAELISTQESLGVGKPFVDVQAQSPEGNKAALSDYAGKGKYVLVDFWATWCAPCKKEAPTLIELYNKYKDKGFEIVSISLDEKKDDWLKSIKEWEMPWIHMSDLGGFKGNAAQSYMVKAIPYMVLISPDGKIIEALKLRGKELIVKLEELFK
ncbi:MAG: AhpC/TSA family protein [Prevotellaceae bacterium]|jgi:thiol-disulfide isomerase/thioredoxin|nr:AhpC/TSA family protein [Prevotellaceae bacterium]